MIISCDNLNSNLHPSSGLAPVLPSGKIVAGRGAHLSNTAMKTVQERFWLMVDKSGGHDACWIWIGFKNKKGYGQFQVDRKTIKSHRFSYLLSNPSAKIDGLDCCHHCDNPSCVNPSHLFVGTRSENMKDMVKKGRQRGMIQGGDRHPCSKLNSEIVRQIKTMITDGIKYKEIGAIFGISKSHVCHINKGRLWKNAAITQKENEK